MSSARFATGAYCNVSETSGRGNCGDTAVVFSHSGNVPNNVAEVWIFDTFSKAKDVSKHRFGCRRSARPPAPGAKA